MSDFFFVIFCPKNIDFFSRREYRARNYTHTHTRTCIYMCLRFGVSPGRYAIMYRCEVVSKVGVTGAIGPSSVTAETRILAFYAINLSRRRNEAVLSITR